VRSEHTIEADQWVARRRYEGRKPGHELHRCHDANGVAMLNSIADATVVQPRQPLEAQRRSGTVAQQSLASFSRTSSDSNPRVQVEAIELDGQALPGLWLLRVLGGPPFRLGWQGVQLPNAERSLQARV
jgi:hypothetical protein